MQFTSASFLILFFPFCVLVNYFLSDKYRNGFLCLMSLAFYFWFGIKSLIIISAMVLVSFGVVKLITAENNQRLKQVFLIAGIAIELGALCYYKYLYDLLVFLTPEGKETIMTFRPALPVGISFYVFSLISYMVEIYWGGVTASTGKIGDLWLYVAFFPKVIQGPIVRYRDFSEQLRGRKIDVDDLNAGLERFIKGLVKKVLIADRLQALVSYSFSNIEHVGSIPAWIGIIAYLFQLYYDFSGYSDMAVGMGRMVGFRLPENFQHPYMAESVAEFWRRWHITLGAWFRDYVYTPLLRKFMEKKWVKKQKDPVSVADIFALIVTWAITGIWHGSGLSFLVYGLWYGLFIVSERLMDRRRKKLKKLGKLSSAKKTRWQMAFGHVITLLVVVVGQVLFRSGSLHTAVRYLGRMLIWNKCDGLLILTELTNYTIVAVAVAALFSFPLYNWVKGKIFCLCEGTWAEPCVKIVYTVVLLAAFVMAFVFSVNSGYMHFLYEVF